MSNGNGKAAPDTLPANFDFSAGGQQTEAPATLPKDFDFSTGSSTGIADPSFGQQIAKQAGDFFTQAEKGVLGTVQSASELINKIPRLGPMLMPTAAVQAGRQAIQQMPQATTLGGKAGLAAEDIGEFVAGDEALKGLSLGEKLLQVGKVADYYNGAHPFAKAAIHGAMNVMRTTAVGAGIGGLKGGEEGAEKGAALGAAGGVAGEALGAAGRGLAKVARGLRDVPEAGMPPGPWIEDTVQADARAGHEQIADSIAKDLGIQRRTLGDPTDPRSPTALRNIYDSLSDQVELEAKGKFKPLDDATDGEFTKLAKALKDNAVKMQKAVDPEVEARLDEEAASLRVRLDEATELAKKNGVDPKLADEGNALWRKKSALADLDAKVKIAMPGKEQVKPTLNVDKLANSMQTLFDSRRLDDISPQRANDLYRQALESVRQQELTRAAATSREEAIKAAQSVRAEAQAKVEQRRARLKMGAMVTGATAVGGALGAKAIKTYAGLTQ